VLYIKHIYLSTNLISALTSLDMYDFPHYTLLLLPTASIPSIPDDCVQTKLNYAGLSLARWVSSKIFWSLCCVSWLVSFYSAHFSASNIEESQLRGHESIGTAIRCFLTRTQDLFFFTIYNCSARHLFVFKALFSSHAVNDIWKWLSNENPKENIKCILLDISYIRHESHREHSFLRLSVLFLLFNSSCIVVSWFGVLETCLGCRCQAMAVSSGFCVTIW
jgi:hypothetical protein